MTNEQATGTDRLALRIADFVWNRPWLAIAAAVVAIFAAASGARFLEFSNNYRVFFSKENPELVAYENFQGTYSKTDNILFVVQPAGGAVFNAEMGSAIEWLTAEAWKIPYATRVDSITNFQHSWADGDDLTVEDLIRNSAALDAAQFADKQNVALLEPLLAGNLISHDADTTGINVTVQYPELSLLEVPEAVGHARELAAQLEADHPDVTVALTGLSLLNNAFAEVGQKDAFSLMPLMFLVLVLFMALVLRSLSGTFATLMVIVGSAATSLGLFGWMGFKLTPISVTGPTIIMTLAIADSVHILVTMLGQMKAGKSKREALRESLRINFLAVVITSITTIVGFLSLNFSDAPPFRDLGNITAMGIAAAFVLSITLLPALVRLLPFRVAAVSAVRKSRFDRGMGRIADWVTAHHRPVLVATSVAALALIAAVPALELNDEWVKYFDHRIEFRGDAEFAMDHLNGLYRIEYSVDSGEAEGINDPEYLAGLERFANWLREQPGVTHVFSYSDIIKRVNRNMNGDDIAFYRIPDDRELAAQYLLLYELSLPYGLDLNDRISVDKSATRVSASVDEISTAEVRRLIDRGDDWLAAHLPERLHADATGATVMFSHISERNINSMLTGNAIALIAIAGIMIVTLRSFSIGALSILPNAVPILATFGLWALLVGQVGMAAATVSATSLGIVVDDTVHFLAKYLRARREQGLDRPGAIRYAFQTVGRAVVSTTLILSAGFAVLAASAFAINAQMGLLTAIAILVALPVDFLLLPSLLMIGHKAQTKEVKMLNRTPSPAIPVWIGVLLLSGAAALAATPQEKGFEVAARADRSDRGFGDSEVELTMVLRNKAGKETQRTLSLTTLEIADEQLGDKSMIVFESPADIDGTALLSHARILDPDDQWLYLPALKRVKRISSVNKSGPFVGSEFAFEDFTALELNKYEYSYLREEPCGERVCDVVERRPRYEHSGYTKQVSWVDQVDFQIRKVEFYDRRGDLLKTLTLEDYRQYEGAYWRAQTLRMVNHQTGKSTDLIYSDYTFGAGLKDDDFVKGTLSRIR